MSLQTVVRAHSRALLLAFGIVCASELKAQPLHQSWCVVFVLRKDHSTKESGFLNIFCRVSFGLVPTLHGLGRDSRVPKGLALTSRRREGGRHGCSNSYCRWSRGPQFHVQFYFYREDNIKIKKSVGRDLSRLDPRRSFHVSQCPGCPCVSAPARSLHRTTAGTALVVTKALSWEASAAGQGQVSARDVPWAFRLRSALRGA